MSKQCIECKLSLPLDDFHNKFGTKAGKHPRCKICRNRLENERAKAKRGDMTGCSLPDVSKAIRAAATDRGMG